MKFIAMSDEHSPRRNPSDHLANGRTFLASIRTSIAIMGFGFVAVKFALFIKQISLAFNRRKLLWAAKVIQPKLDRAGCSRCHAGIVGLDTVSYYRETTDQSVLSPVLFTLFNPYACPINSWDFTGCLFLYPAFSVR
jgi:uncharacterized membrane protein YidH (DUF202 family)